MKKRRNVLLKERMDARELISVIENLPEEKKLEVLGIIKGYALCSENSHKVSNK